MNIWIMRHGEASFNAATDSQRSLTRHGQESVIKQGEWLIKRLENQKMSLDSILVSPYLRTQQTLEKLMEGMQRVRFSEKFANESLDIEIWEGLAPSGNSDQVQDYLACLSNKGVQNVLIISHLPLVYDLVHTLTCGQSNVHFYPAVIAEIVWQNGGGKWVLTKFPTDDYSAS